VSNPRILGIGLGEDTGLLITHNSRMEAIGSGLVIIVDGREIKDTNLTQIELGQPISISHLVTHVLSKYDTFDIKTNKMHINSSQYADDLGIPID
jgi:cyanophycinase